MKYTLWTLGTAGANVIGALFGGVMSVFWLIWVLVNLAAMWQIFEKAGLAGWKSLIPFYNQYCMYRIAFGSDKGWLFLLTIIPGVAQIMDVVKNVKLSQNFGFGIGFAIGLSLLTPIFNLILGFGNAWYMGEELY